MSDEQETELNGDSLIDRLLNRHVIQTAAIYVAVAWGAVEILITLTEKLGWPDWINTVALSIFVAGFPVIIILSWYRDVQSKTARSLLVVLAVVMGVTAFWVVITSSGPPDSETARAGPYQTETIATVAVLPFENLTGDESQQYIANGFTDDIISRLSKHPDLAVIQYESATSPILASLIPTAKAARLSADYFISGGLKKEGNYYEISAHLQDIDGNVLWSESFRDPLTADNLLSTQKRISGEVSRIVGTTLSAPAYCGESANMTAMEFYYQGRNRILMRQSENIEAGIELLKKAVEEDRYYGRAWNILGEGYLALPAWIMGPEKARATRATHYPMGNAALEHALKICPTLGLAYKVVVPSYEGVTNGWADQELQYVAIRSDDFDFAFEVLNALVDGYNFASYMPGPGGLWISLPTLNRFRADPRFAELMERVGLAEYWREFGWSERCQPDGDSFSCS